MRCKACDVELTDFEATRRSAITAEFLDLCPHCLATIMDVLNTTENFRLYDPDKDILEFEVPIESPESLRLPDGDKNESEM